MKRRLLILLLVCVPFLFAGYSFDGNLSPRVVANMWFTVNHTEEFGAGDHVKFDTLYETHPAITNCDVTTDYGTCSVTTETTCNIEDDCPGVETCVVKPWDTPSLGRCDLMPATYMFSLTLNAVTTGATCTATYQVFNTTGNFLETANKASKVSVLLSNNNYAGSNTMVGSDMGIATVTEQSWVEVRLGGACADLGSLDHGNFLIERLKNYAP